MRFARLRGLFHFLSYHNAAPAALVVMTLGASGAFAATATGVLPLPSPGTPSEAPPQEPEAVDASALLFADIASFDFHPTVADVIETDEAYTVSYSLQTLAPESGAWGPYEKTGRFTVAKNALDDTGLQGHVVAKLRDVENAERAYLSRAQEAERSLAQAQSPTPAARFASLVGLSLDQIPEPVIAKPAPSSSPESPQAAINPTPPAAPPVSGQPEPAAAGPAGAPDTADTASSTPVAASSTPPLMTATTTSPAAEPETEPRTASTTPAVSTTTPATDTIDYVAENAAGTSTSTRTIIIDAQEPTAATFPATSTPAQ